MEIPKPDGGVRNLGVPTVTDRIIQQAIIIALDMINDGYDWIIMVGSEMSAKRVTRNLTKFIEGKLGLKVNMTKSKVDRPSGLKYLGFGFYFDSRAHQFKAKPHAKSIAKFKARMKQFAS